MVGCVTDGPVVTIEADRVTMPLNDQQTLLANAGRADEGGGVMTCCGMQNEELHVLTRVLRAPFTLDMTIHFNGGKAEMTLSGVGQESKTFALTKK